MTKAHASRQRRLSRPANVARGLAAGAVLGWFCLNIGAQERTDTSEPVDMTASGAMPADLEKAFWLCDYAGTTGGVDSGTGIACSMITEQLKNRNFNGDFEAMVAWWRERKPAEHQRLEAARRLSRHQIQ